jgi:hypothetical protein
MSELPNRQEPAWVSQFRSRRCGGEKNLFPLSKMKLGILSNCVYFRKRSFTIDTLYVNFLLHVSALTAFIRCAYSMLASLLTLYIG